MTDATSDSLDDALAAVRAHTDAEPEMVLILGSGLGALADEAEDAVIIPTADIPGYPRSTVPGHAGRLVFGRLEGRSVLFVQGRVHLYEGHPPRALPFPVRLAHALGARKLLVTNAAGGIDPTMGPGTLMFIADHLNLEPCILQRIESLQDHGRVDAGRWRVRPRGHCAQRVADQGGPAGLFRRVAGRWCW